MDPSKREQVVEARIDRHKALQNLIRMTDDAKNSDNPFPVEIYFRKRIARQIVALGTRRLTSAK